MTKPMAARRVSLTVSLDVEQLTMIDNYAAEYGITTSEAVRELLQKGRAHQLQQIAREDLGIDVNIEREFGESPGEQE